MKSPAKPAATPDTAPIALERKVTDLITLFDRLFASGYRTRLAGGGEEPLYRPATDGGGWHQIIFTRDYFASALHEVAHWCIAGTRRRQLLDYGYWYAPDGRDRTQQRAFERVEAKPQALEWIFSRAAGCGFRLSADNLDGGCVIGHEFKRAVWQQAQSYCLRGLPGRAAEFATGLAELYGGRDFSDAQAYSLEAI